MTPPAPEAWSHAFRTAPFGFVRASLISLPPKGTAATVALVFSGPVDREEVRKRARFTVDGQPITRMDLGSTAPEQVTFRLIHPKLGARAKVRIQLAAGLASTRGGGHAPAVDETLTLPEGKRIDLLSAQLQEGSTGFYLEVRCREVEPDGSPLRATTDDEDGRAEDRCALDEDDALSAIHFNPSVKVSLASSRNGFRVFGDFQRGPYVFSVDAGAIGKGGGTTYTRFEQAITVPARRPQLSFAASGRYLPRSAWKNLAVNHLNVEQAELEIRHVPAENLVFWLSDPYRETPDERTSNLVVKKTVPLSAPQD